MENDDDDDAIFSESCLELLGLGLGMINWYLFRIKKYDDDDDGLPPSPSLLQLLLLLHVLLLRNCISFPKS